MRWQLYHSAVLTPACYIDFMQHFDALACSPWICALLLPTLIGQSLYHEALSTIPPNLKLCNPTVCMLIGALLCRFLTLAHNHRQDAALSMHERRMTMCYICKLGMHTSICTSPCQQQMRPGWCLILLRCPRDSEPDGCPVGSGRATPDIYEVLQVQD